MRNRFLLFMAFAMTVMGLNAKTLRVNNTPGSGAPYSNFADAQKDASDGDVIIVEGSNKNYGKIKISKKITLKGPGYLLADNNIYQEGASSAKFEEIRITADGAKVTGLTIGNIIFVADEISVVRNDVDWVYLCENGSFTDNVPKKCVIHQNYINYGIRGDSYSSAASNMQITNNIIARIGDHGLFKITDSVIARNSFIGSENFFSDITNCVIENNIGYKLDGNSYSNKDNSFKNNFDLGTLRSLKDTYESRVDNGIKEGDSTLEPNKEGFTVGAFSGDDPYVLSGVPSGLIIEDVTLPESVKQGEDLNVTIKIGLSQ